MKDRYEMIKELRMKSMKTLNDDLQMKFIFINVLIRDKKFRQFCGDGSQKIRWLTDCAIFKYENSGEKRSPCGIAYGLKTEHDELIDLNCTIADKLTNGMNVMVLLKEEYEVEMEDRERLKIGEKRIKYSELWKQQNEPKRGSDREEEGELELQNNSNDYSNESEGDGY